MASTITDPTIPLAIPPLCGIQFPVYFGDFPEFCLDSDVSDIPVHHELHGFSLLARSAARVNRSGSKRFGKGRAREGKNLSSKDFSFSHLAFA